MIAVYVSKLHHDRAIPCWWWMSGRVLKLRTVAIVAAGGASCALLQQRTATAPAGPPSKINSGQTSGIQPSIQRTQKQHYGPLLAGCGAARRRQ